MHGGGSWQIPSLTSHSEGSEDSFRVCLADSGSDVQIALQGSGMDQIHYDIREENIDGVKPGNCDGLAITLPPSDNPEEIKLIDSTDADVSAT